MSRRPTTGRRDLTIQLLLLADPLYSATTRRLVQQ